MTEVTVLLRTWNAGAYLDPLLDILDGQTLPPAEILVVDSTSTDGTPERARARGARIVSLPQSRFTHAGSTNLGFREARFPVVAMLSQDALPASPDWLADLTAPLADSGTAAVYGRQVPRPDCFALERWEIERCYPDRGEPEVVYSNVNSVARKQVWEDLPFDETVLIAEDRFWARAVRERGLSVVYSAEAAVLHSHEYTLSQLYTRCREEARARRLMENHAEGPGLLVKGWPKQTLRDGRRLVREGKGASWPRAAAYRFAQFAGLVAGGRG